MLPFLYSHFTESCHLVTQIGIFIVYFEINISYLNENKLLKKNTKFTFYLEILEHFTFVQLKHAQTNGVAFI